MLNNQRLYQCTNAQEFYSSLIVMKPFQYLLAQIIQLKSTYMKKNHRKNMIEAQESSFLK